MIVKNIILDLGGVILDVSYENTAAAFKELGIKNFDEVYSQKKQEHFFDNYEKGIISDDEFRNEIRKSFSAHISDEQIDEAWNSLILTIPKERFNFLVGLKRKYRLFLLSNTNTIHITEFTKLFENDFGKNAFDNLFEKIYYSCFLKMRKPDAEIFNLVMNENNLDYSQTIFIDDSIQHVEGARKAGLTSFHLDTKNSDLKKLLQEIFLKTLNFKL
ncbi:MAG: HAD family hydrolase [Bacteroidia bacterium]